MPPAGDLALNPGMCPDWESNRQCFGSQAGTQSTDPHQPGLISCRLCLLNHNHPVTFYSGGSLCLSYSLHTTLFDLLSPSLDGLYSLVASWKRVIWEGYFETTYVWKYLGWYKVLLQNFEGIVPLSSVSSVVSLKPFWSSPCDYFSSKSCRVSSASHLFWNFMTMCLGVGLFSYMALGSHVLRCGTFSWEYLFIISFHNRISLLDFCDSDIGPHGLLL